MKELACRDLGMDCNFVGKGKTNDEVKQKLFAHAEKAHPDMVKTMTPDKKKELTNRMDAALKAHVRL